MKPPLKKKCKYCGEMAVLMDLKELGASYKGVGRYYYYHYSTDYSKGCKQRLSVKDESLVEWTKKDQRELDKKLKTKKKR